MQELIKIIENGNGQKAVSARHLHAYLEIKSDFTDWCKRMFDYGFDKNTDYIILPKNKENNISKSNPIDYAFTLDMAKELSMLQRTEKGKQARLYFIEMEKIARSVIEPINPFTTMSRKEMLLLAAELEEENERLQIELKAASIENETLQIVTDLQKQQLQLAAPKVKYVEDVLKSESAHTTTIIAKEMGMSAVALNSILHQKGVIFRASGGTWVLYAKYEDKGYAKTTTYTYTDSHNETRTSINTVWTEKGREFIHGIIDKQSKTA